LFVSLSTGKVLSIVDKLRGRRRVDALLSHLNAFRGVEPYKGNWRTPQVLYNSERHIAPPSQIPQRLGAADSHKPHVSGLPGMRLPYRTQPPAAVASYALYILHDPAILQPTAG
jgi:hypothetical protein